MTYVENLIIGAGPAGLAVAGRMRHAGIDFSIMEKGNNVGERWHHHYDRLHLHTVKKWSHLPHLPFPKDYPLYVSREQLVKYFDAYARHFRIDPQFDTSADQITRLQDGTWKVNTNKGELLAEHVIVATGVNRIPNRPKWDRIEMFRGRVMHSIDYRNPDVFSGKSVLVVGMGNTGAEIALDLCEAGIPVWISVRGPVSIVPRDLNGIPVQVTAKLLGKLPFGLGDWIGAQVQNRYFGDLSQYGLQRSSIYPAKQLRATGKTPVIDTGSIEAVRRGNIRVVGGIRHFIENGVVLQNGDTVHCDAVILATGYRPQLEDLISGIETFLDRNGYPQSPIGTMEFDRLYFVGFDNYKPGGILGTIYNDSEQVVNHIRQY